MRKLFAMLLVVTFSASVWSCTDEYDDTAI